MGSMNMNKNVGPIGMLPSIHYPNHQLLKRASLENNSLRDQFTSSAFMQLLDSGHFDGSFEGWFLDS